VIMASTIISKPRSAARSGASTCSARSLLGTRLRRRYAFVSPADAAPGRSGSHRGADGQETRSNTRAGPNGKLLRQALKSASLRYATTFLARSPGLGSTCGFACGCAVGDAASLTAGPGPGLRIATGLPPDRGKVNRVYMQPGFVDQGFARRTSGSVSFLKLSQPQNLHITVGSRHQAICDCSGRTCNRELLHLEAHGLGEPPLRQPYDARSLGAGGLSVPRGGQVAARHRYVRLIALPARVDDRRASYQLGFPSLIGAT
jgi:hypothetical protein